MKIEITKQDVTKAADGELDAKSAEKFLKQKKKEVEAAMMEAAREVLDDWVFDFSIDLDDEENEDEDEDNEEDDDDGDD